MRLKSITLPVCSVLMVAACAAQPRPEEVCTAEWIQPRVDNAMSEFRASTDDIMQQLKGAGDDSGIDSGNDSGIGLLERAGVLISLVKLLDTFQNSETLKDLNTLSDTCDQPDLVIDAFTGVLKEYDVPESFISLLEELDGFKALLEDAAAGSDNSI